MRRFLSVVIGAVVAVALVVAGVAWWLGADDSPTQDASPTPTPTPTSTESAEPTREPAPVARPVTLRRDPAYCEPVRRPFAPTSISVAGVTRGSTVLSVPRDANGVPGVPPVSTEGKSQFAFDAPGIHPGSDAGNVILTAHTWPDGTAMGNRLLAKLDEGERLTLHGPRGQKVCYQVTDRLEVTEANAPLGRVYDTDGRPQAVIIVCSGTRLGPGVWTHRMLWFASPV